jgi:phosphoribosyl 1,2-cyclic phosphate phosphodiesterase
MRIVFTGTGTSQGVPVIGCPCEVCASANPKDKRLRSSVYLELDNGKNIVIDTGPDFRQQMLQANVNQLHAVLFTHEHKDHIAGLDDIRSYNFLMKRKVDVFASAAVERALRREFHYIFDDNPYPGIPEINLAKIDTNPFDYAGQQIIPIEVMHYKMPVLGFRINDFTYITDANYIAPKELDKIAGTKVLVLNALRKSKHISHFNLEEAIELVHLIKPEQAYFTHISHLLGKHDDVTAELPENIHLLYDGLELKL